MPIIDLDPGHSPDLQASILVEALTRPGSETIVVYRGDQRYVPTVSSVESEQDENGPEIEAPDRAVLVAASPFERRALVEGYLRQELARLLGASLSDEDLDMPVQSLGLDSLMAIQVRNRVEMSLGVALSLVDFLKGLRVRQLVENILDQLSAEPARIETVERTTHRSPVVDEPVGDLSEPELDSLLVSLLDSDAPDAS
jgi:acyl carrier protein